jgi:hypothetical protein
MRTASSSKINSWSDFMVKIGPLNVVQTLTHSMGILLDKLACPHLPKKFSALYATQGSFQHSVWSMAVPSSVFFRHSDQRKYTDHLTFDTSVLFCIKRWSAEVHTRVTVAINSGRKVLCGKRERARRRESSYTFATQEGRLSLRHALLTIALPWHCLMLWFTSDSR